MPKDLVSAALRAVEQEVDSAYLENGLVRLTFGEAAWYFMAFCEERLIHPILKGTAESATVHDQAALADEITNHTKSSLRWLWQTCPKGQIVPDEYNDAMYGASQELSKLASNYLTFESAFTYAGMGIVDLRLDGRRIVPSGPLSQDTRFEAYDRLTDIDDIDQPLQLDFVATLVRDMVYVKGSRFSCPLSAQTVRTTLRHFETKLNQRFRLPGTWTFPGYTLGQYACVAKCLWVMSAIHFVSRLIAAARGCPGFGYSQALVIMDHEEIRRRIANYTGTDEKAVQAVLADLTYGGGGMRCPDPALQPLFRLTDKALAWAPGLFLNNALERNLIVLINRLPDARDAYSRLSQQKESLLRSRIVDELVDLGFRFWHGDVVVRDERFDVDLAVISEKEKCCLLLELKSFIAPAEAREIRDRSEEIARGVQQITTRRSQIRAQPAPWHAALRVSSDFELVWAVASETSIGAGWIQDISVPVVKASHLVRKLRQSGFLTEVGQWLMKREYLPLEGKDYKRVDVRIPIANWELEWYGLKGLRERETA